ncbi:hypothetical protein KIMH_02240 [Bombiscardovia apis]|uniref:Glycosyltransferase n=1 Tax=Bombiscardovia apis TaxID=2932182 RepID=A0ABN6SEP4_9BIFI|nr:glycosyltransferase [Bombiscardovia apis]BDR54113.1 hypothetical protein KIMH_02240 [Bombiscardovia apis]
MSSAAQWQGQRVLITQSSLVRIGGSEVQAYELAHYLKAQGCRVTMYAWLAAAPMLDLLEESGISVITSSSEESALLHARDFDLVWVQHEVLPASLIEDLAQEPVQRPRFIFAHMSPYREVHLEQPYIYGLEDGLADLIVCNAPSTLEAQKPYFAAQDKLVLYPNPAPQAFAQQPHTMHEQLAKVLIVSNHAPSELLQAADVLRQQGIEVDILNDVVGGQPQLTSPELLDQYDCVISIGKTVQYCLVQGVPVFLYDRFGGPGYLNASNCEQAAQFNFSGRSQGGSPSLVQAQQECAKSRLEPQLLAQLIVDGYAQACAFQGEHREQFVKQYAIDGVFTGLMERLNQRPQQPFEMSEVYRSYLVRHSQMVTDYNQSIQFAANPVVRFYQQAVRVYLGQSTNMNASNLAPAAYPLREETKLDIDCRNQQVVRVDFGEEPCLVTGLKAESGALDSLNMSTNADIELEGVYLFMAADPQVYFHSPGSLKQLSVRAQVYPLSHIPAPALAKLSQEIRTRQQHQMVQLDYWYSLRNNPCVRLLVRLRRRAQKLIKGRA